MNINPHLEVALNLLLALIGGGLIGWERSFVGRAAGFVRTS